MSGALFHAGNRRPPKSRSRRIALDVAILAFSGALAPFAIVGAVDAWRAGTPIAALAFTVLAFVLVLGAVTSLVVAIRTLLARRDRSRATDPR